MRRLQLSRHGRSKHETLMTILIVEDNAGIRRMIRRTLIDAASTVWECCDGAEALTSFYTYRPEIVLMDIQMPGIDGLAATRLIKLLDPKACVVIVTDHDDDDLRRAAFEAGAADYLLKQNLTELPNILASLIMR
jgi:CheY-like chemotaxis protein